MAAHLVHSQFDGARVTGEPHVHGLARADIDPALRFTLDALDDEVALLSQDGEIVLVNRAWVAFGAENGYTDRRVGLGANYAEICSAASGRDSAEAAPTARGIRHVLAGDVERYELDYPCNSPTSERWFHVSVRGVANALPVAAVVIHADRTRIHDEERLRGAAESRFKRLSDASSDGVVVSRDGILLEVNAACCRLFRASETELIGTSLLLRYVDEDQEQAREWIMHNVEAAYPATLRRLDGTTFDADITGRPIWHDGPARVSVIRDVSDARHVQRMKDEFVSTVSHELRTPLTAIYGTVRLLEGGALGPLPENALGLLTIARTNSDRLIRLINDLLDLDKMAGGHLALTPVPLPVSELLHAASAGVRPIADQARVTIEPRIEDELTGGELTIVADRDRILQVLTNLLSNALKFAPPESVVSLVATALHAGGARIAVSNDGEGIAAADIPRLFQRFQQLDSSDHRSRGGTGLGLAISKAIVEQHGGRIGVESTPHARTTFWIEIPGIATRPAAVGA